MNDRIFAKCLERVFKAEGGYSNDPDDPGGETKFGISKRRYPSVDIKHLTKEQATEIYRVDYWQPLNFHLLVDPALVSEIFDFAVNSGPARAVKELQELLNDCFEHELVIDGKIGPKTANACNKLAFQHEDVLVWAYKASRVNFYRGLDRDKYNKGWFRRVFTGCLLPC